MAKIQKIKWPPYTPGAKGYVYDCETDRECRENQICVGGMCRSESGDPYTVNERHKCTPESNKTFLTSQNKRIRERIKDNDWSYVYRYNKSPDTISRPKTGAYDTSTLLAQWHAGDFDDATLKRLKSLHKKYKKK